MAAVLQDSFAFNANGSTGRATMQRRGWSIVDGGTEVTLNHGGGPGGESLVAITQRSGGAYVQAPIVMSGAELALHVKWKPDVAVAADVVLELFGNSGADRVCSLRCTSARALALYNSANTLVATSAAGVFSTSLLHRVVVHISAIGNTSTVTVYVNGVAVITQGSVDTSITATTCDLIRLRGPDATVHSGAWSWTELFVCDGSGSVNNDPVMDWKMVVLDPTADTATEDFTRSAGTDSYALLDDPTTGDDDADTTYIESGTAAHKTRLAYEDLAGSVSSVLAVALVTSVRKTDAGVRTMRGHVFSNATQGNGATIDPGQAYQTQVDIFNLDPDGAIAWTPGKVNALQAGVEIVS